MALSPELLEESLGEVRNDGVLCGGHIVPLERRVWLRVIEEEDPRLMNLGWGLYARLHGDH